MRWSPPWSWRSVVVLAAALTCATDAARILAFETMSGMSHWNFLSGVLQTLVDNGHAVTVFTPFPAAGGHRPRDNYTEVDMSRELLAALDGQVMDVMQRWRISVDNVVIWARRSRGACDKIYGHPAMRDVLRSRRDARGQPFDVVIVEPFLSDCVSYVAGQLGVPLVYATAMPAIGLMERVFTGHVGNPASVSNLAAGHGIPKTFAQRLSNSVLFAYSHAAIGYADMVLKWTEPKEYDAVPPVKPSLMFVNNHYISEPPNPVLPSVINIGGIHLRPPKALPEDILEFIEQSTHGVIYFTFGSTVKMSSVPKHIKNAFIDVLAKLPQRVLWKYEDELENKPANIMMKKWLPQRDILMHPKVKLFISHGGISGLYEAVDAGVPILGFPLFGDQHRNIDNLVNAGMAISMDLLSVSEETLSKNVIELLNNKKYTINAKTTSKVFKDRPMTPAQSVVYWTEYVIRHKGAPHLKSHAVNLTWYQYYLLDVISFVIILISVVLFAIYKIFKCIYKCTSTCYHNVKAKIE